jgi:hypothetical protein
MILLALPSSPAWADETARRSFRCKVSLFGPALDFELRFFTGFQLTAPAKQLAGPRRYFALRVLVEPHEREGAQPALFERDFLAGPIPPGGEFQLRDSFASGPGRYKVTWVMVDSAGASCSVTETIKAELDGSERDLDLRAQPGQVFNSRLRLFRPERAIVFDDSEAPLRVKVFLNLDVPRSRGRTRIRAWEIMPRISALRALSRHPRVGELSMVAYSVEDQTVVSRHRLRDAFDYRSLRRSIDDLEPGFVSVEQLERDSDLGFFNEMLLEELPGDEEVDAYIFLGPDVFVRKNREKELLESIGPLGAPTFFLADGRAPWKGLIGKTVGFFGGKTYRFYDPGEMAEAVDRLVEDLERAE